MILYAIHTAKKPIVKPLQAHGLISPFIMRLIYAITHKLSLLLPTPKFMRIESINNTWRLSKQLRVSVYDVG